MEFDQKAISGHLNRTINKLVKDGLVERTEEKLQSSKQKYDLQEKGMSFTNVQEVILGGILERIFSQQIVHSKNLSSGG